MAVFTVEVTVTLKDGVLDPQGSAIEKALGGLGFTEVREVRSGKLFRLRLEAEDASQAQAAAGRMAKRLLANPVLETFQLAVQDR